MVGSICDILPSVAAVLGHPAADDRLGLRPWLGGVRRIATVLVDGLGYQLLPLLASRAPLLAAVLGGSVGRLDELISTFPSTTPTSLVSLGTGEAPGAHGVLGFTLNVPGSDRVLSHIRWRDDPPAAQWQPRPTWFSRLRAAGIPARVVLPAIFVGSGLSDAAYRGAEFRPVGKGTEYAQCLVQELAAGPGLVYGYTAELDTAAHRHGVGSPAWLTAAAGVDALLEHLVAELPPDAALLVTADHGGLNVPADRRVDIGTDSRLAAGLRVVAGEPRVRYLHTVAGAAPDVLATWRAVLGARADVVTRDEAVAAGWFGAVRPEHLARIGDVVVVGRDDWAVLATDREPPEVAKLVGFHGGPTPVETAIPLIGLRG